MKNLAGVLGLVLIIGTIAGGNLKYLGDWSTSELVGYNTWSIIAVVGGIYLVYWAFIKKQQKSTSEKKEQDNSSKEL